MNLQCCFHRYSVNILGCPTKNHLCIEIITLFNKSKQPFLSAITLNLEANGHWVSITSTLNYCHNISPNLWGATLWHVAEISHSYFFEFSVKVNISKRLRSPQIRTSRTVITFQNGIELIWDTSRGFMAYLELFGDQIRIWFRGLNYRTPYCLTF